MGEPNKMLPGTAVEEYFTSLSNWGRWGGDDRRGTLNLITPAVRREAVRSVRSGVAVSLARDIDPVTPDPLHSGMATVERKTDVREVERALGVKMRWDAFADHIVIAPHGGNAHLDGLAHYSWDDKYYNGFDADATTVDGGAVDLAVHHAADGLITRGVLLDIAGLFGVEYVERGYAVTPADLEAAEARQGVTVRAGDALLIHTGNAAAILAHGPLNRGNGDHGPLDNAQTGLDASALPFLWERDVAIMGADGTHDVQPPQYSDLNFARPIHSVCLVALGLWLMDNLDLTELAARCADNQQWDFLFTANPWRFVGSTSSPLNPVAIL
ncbi:cyclase family protein [Nocardia tengchongensis]|uniref:cyclase family protein n=1 Tax=Nocardia tengchongensis TaxID=2055889 RepID=UPI0036857417